MVETQPKEMKKQTIVQAVWQNLHAEITKLWRLLYKTVDYHMISFAYSIYIYM